MSEEVDMSRTAVKTYIPAYQKEEWQTHADNLGMSQSEFVRVMVQAGRREFGENESQSRTNELEEPTETKADLSEEVTQALGEAEALSWEELLPIITDDIERRLEDCLDHLQEQNIVKYSGRKGGYSLTES